jgi:hypothetical protein
MEFSYKKLCNTTTGVDTFTIVCEEAVHEGGDPVCSLEVSQRDKKKGKRSKEMFLRVVCTVCGKTELFLCDDLQIVRGVV